jgi:hypothetical protein
MTKRLTTKLMVTILCAGLVLESGGAELILVGVDAVVRQKNGAVLNWKGFARHARGVRHYARKRVVGEGCPRD